MKAPKNSTGPIFLNNLVLYWNNVSLREKIQNTAKMSQK